MQARIKQWQIVFILLAFSSGISAQDTVYDTIAGRSDIPVYLRFGCGPSIIAIDLGYYFQNEIIAEFSKNVAISAGYGIGSAYAGMKDVQRWYFPDAVPGEDDVNRHQSLVTLNLSMQISLLNKVKHRLYIGFGPALNFYTYSEGSIVPYGNITIYKLSNKQTTRMALNYFAGYEFKAGEHLLFGIGLNGSEFTERMYSLLLSIGYRF